jgi:hypothetical protein
MVSLFLSGVVMVIGACACVSGNGFLGQVIGRVLMLGALLCGVHGVQETTGSQASAQCVMAWAAGVSIAFAAWILLGMTPYAKGRYAWLVYAVAIALAACGVGLLAVAL